MYTWRFIKDLFLHLKYSRIINKVIQDEGIIQKFSQLYGVEFRRDWVGRIYAVINPHIKDGKYDPTAVAYENTLEGFDMSQYLQNWIMERMAVASRFINTNNLFELLTYNITKLDDDDNFLFVVQPITLPELWSSMKKSAWEIVVLGILGIATYFGINHFIS